MPDADEVAQAIARNARQLRSEREWSLDQLATRTADFARDPASAAIFLNHGQPFTVGQTLVQKDLARTLRAISRDGADGFYKGPVAAAIVASPCADRHSNGSKLAPRPRAVPSDGPR